MICPIDGFGNIETGSPILSQSLSLSVFPKRYLSDLAQFTTASTSFVDVTGSQFTATETGSFIFEQEIYKSGSYNMDIQILKNGVAVWSLTNQSQTTYTKVTSSAIAVVNGDVVKVQIRCTSSF